MAFENNCSLTFTSAGEITQLALVSITSAGQVEECLDADVAVIGVALDSASAAGEAIPVQPIDSCKVNLIADAAIAVGSPITPANDGEIRVATSGDPVIGYALEAAAAAGEQIEVFLQASPAALA